MKMLSDNKRLQTSIDAERLSLENQVRQISYAINKLIEHDKAIDDLRSDNHELRTRLESLESMQSVPDKRKVRNLRVIK